MGKTYTGIEGRNAEFIRAQRMFFVASAPADVDGLVNLSPKGLDSFAILNENTVAYLDLVGSGIETVGHLRENGRIVFLFCAFDGPPRLLRLHGRGEVIQPGDPDWEELLGHFPHYDSARSIIRVAVTRVADSCGYGVPLYDFRQHRDSLLNYFREQSADEIVAYRRKRNSVSLDGLPGLTFPDD